MKIQTVSSFIMYCGRMLLHCAVMGAMFLFYYNGVNTTEMLERCVLPANAGAKVWNRCTKRLIDACQPGMYKIGNCTGQESCKSCPEGTFTSGWNNCSSCFSCTVCEYGIEEPCSAERNTRCKEAPESNPHDPETLGITTIPSRNEPTSTLSTSRAADLDLITTTSDRNHSFPPTLAKTESVETSTAPGRRQEEIVENGQGNRETLLEYVGTEMEDLDRREQAG